MKIKLTSVPVVNQKKALTFYTEILGFVKKREIPMGDVSFLTVVSPEEQDGTELLLEPNGNHPMVKQLKESLFKEGIPFTAFEVDNIQKEYIRMKKLGVRFTQSPIKMGETTQAVFNDTCGNLIQIYQVERK